MIAVSVPAGCKQARLSAEPCTLLGTSTHETAEQVGETMPAGDDDGGAGDPATQSKSNYQAIIIPTKPEAQNPKLTNMVTDH